jgi:hypothetical protein
VGIEQDIEDAGAKPMRPGQVPSVGRKVHYVAYGVPGKFPSVCRSADITEVNDAGDVGLAVLNPTGLFFHPIAHENGPCPYDEGMLMFEQRDGKPVNFYEYAGGSWHWPERVGP